MPLRHQEAVRQLRRIGEGLSERPDHVEELVGLELGEPGGPGATRIEDELERAGPAASPGGLVDREVTPQQERAVRRHPDREELARTHALGHLRRDERQGVVHTQPAGVEDLGSDPPHRWISPWSTTLGPPETSAPRATGIWVPSRASAVPRVARSRDPASAGRSAGDTIARSPGVATLTDTVPARRRGRRPPDRPVLRGEDPPRTPGHR